MTNQPKLDWRTIDVEQLPANLRKAYDAYKAAQKAASAVRAEFEAAVSAHLAPPAGKRIAFSYNFGQLSMAITADTGKAKPKAGGIALSDLR